MNRAFTFGSVCSGIEAASVAWHPFGWQTGFVSEIDAHASAVLRYRFPDVPNLGDFTAWPSNSTQRRNLPWLYERCSTIDVLVGGTPCQDFSVAGLRRGMAGARGGLTMSFLRMARRLRPEWVVWENVPGVLSSNGGRDFGAFLGALAELGYGFAYRVLDAQYAGVPQRRRRVFVVGHLGDWRRAAAVLLERESLSGHSAPSREAGASVTGALTSGASVGGGWRVGADEAAAGQIVGTLTDASGRRRMNGVEEAGAGHLLPLTAYQCHGSNVGPMGTLRAGNGNESGGVPFVMATGQGGAEIVSDGDPSLTCDHEAPIAFNWQSGGDCRQNPSASGTDALHVGQTPAIAFMERGRGADNARTVEWQEEVAYAQDVKAGGGAGSSRWVGHAMQVRRLTPRECERLQGFPDDWTATGDYGAGPVPVSDSQRYKMCGNSMAVPVMSWIGQRINLIRSLP